jgi:hypothetical protein
MGRNVSSLRDHWVGDNELCVITRHNLGRMMPVLENAYKNVYLPHFPLKADWDSLDTFLKIMRDPDADRDITIIVAGTNLHRPTQSHQPCVKGICIGNYLKESDTAHLDYMAVDARYRTEALGYALFKAYSFAVLDVASEHDGVIEGLFINCQDPKKPIAKNRNYESYDPIKRIQKYESWGARHLPLDYKIGYITPTNGFRIDETDALLAFEHPMTHTYPGPSVVQQHIKALWQTYSPDHDISSVPAYRETMRSARNLHMHRAREQSNGSTYAEFIKSLA